MLKLLMSKRVNVRGTYMIQREKSTSAGAKGTFIGKWSPSNVGTAQGDFGKKSAQQVIKNYGRTLDWLGGGDKKKR